MTRRRVLLLGSVAVVTALLVWVVWPTPSAINRENAKQIAEGMSLSEVEALLGGPSRNDATRPISVDMPRESPAQKTAADDTQGRIALYTEVARQRHNVRVWQSDSAFVMVRFEDGKVCAQTCFPLRPAPETPLAMLRRWFGL